MPTPSAAGVLRASAVISKTGENLMGVEIPCAGYSWLGLYLNYTKGDETGLYVFPYVLWKSGGDEHPWVVWATVGGVYTATAQKLHFTATAKRHFVFDVRGIEIMKFYQGGSNNDGTPTGTLSAAYTLDEG
jgi:hypothetical protein